MKTKFMYHAIKIKEDLIAMIFFVRFNFKKHCNLNKKKYETKDK